MGRKIAGILLIALVLSLELNSILLLRVYTQPEGFARKLEDYLGKAIPEDLLAEECEYVVPEGFNLTFAERLWRSLSFHVSAGYDTGELRRELRRIYGNSSLVNATLSNGEIIALNLSGIAVERNLDDGSVSIRMPVASSISLNYTRYNFTKQAGFYEAWNKTLVRKYRVWRREPGWYTYVFEDLESNRSFTIVSRVWGEASRVEEAWLEGLRKLGGGAWNESVRYIPSFEYTKWGWMRVSGPVVAIPGRYEDVRILFPEHKRNFRVLFPAYDPLIIEGWAVSINFSSTSLRVGETLEISYLAEYWSPWGLEPEPLNATLSLNVPESFETLDGPERRLDETHTAGVFRLRAVKPGTYNLTLSLDGNAVFANTASNEESYAVQVVSPAAPSLSIEIVERDTSVLKHARLILRLANDGGGAARDVTIDITGSDMEGVSRSLGSIEAGESRDVELNLRLLQPASMARIRVTYSDDDGNPYFVCFETMVSTETFWVPEHFREYTVVVPEHEDTMRVFVPGFEQATHIRLYALWDERILGEAIFYGEKLGAPVYDVEYLRWALYNRTGLSMGLVSIPVPGLGAELSISEGREALRRAGVKIMVKSIEPHYKYLGVLKEDEALRLVNADKEPLRNGNVSSDFRVEPLKPYWVKGDSVLLNATQLALYQAVMNEVKKTNPDISYESRETVADVRTKVGKAEPGYIVLIYRPLKVVGEGPLKSIRVRNFAGIGLDYRVSVETFILTVFGKASDENGWKRLYLKGMEDAVLLSSTLDSYRREVNVNLTCNGKLVAKARFILEPEPSPFWKGFWDGLASQAWRIALTGVIMVVLSVASKGTVGALALRLSVLTILSTMILINAASQYKELGLLLSTVLALKEVEKSLSEQAGEFHALGYPGAAGLFSEAAAEVQLKVQTINLDLYSIADFLSRVCADFSLREWGILLGLEEAGEYEKGLIWGKAVGNAISLLIFITGFCHLAASGTTPASLGGKAKRVLQGIWNWITPAMTDAVGVVRNTPKLAKGYGMLLTVFRVAREFGCSLVDVLRMDTKAAMDLVGLYTAILDKISKAAKDGKVDDDAVQGIIEFDAKATGLGKDALSMLSRNIDSLFSKNEEFAGKFFGWAKRAKPGLEWVIEITGKLGELGGDDLKSMGKALARVGDSLENGVKLFDTYFRIPASYGGFGTEAVEKISNVFLENVEKYGIKALDAWSLVIEYSEKYKVVAVPASVRSIEIGGEDRKYPVVLEDIVEALRLKSEENIVTLFVRKGSETYRILGECGKPETVKKDFTVYPILPQEALRREGRFTDLFSLKTGDFVAIFKGAVEPDFFFTTEKGVGEKVKVKLTSIWGEKFIEAHGYGDYFVYYRRIDEQSLHHAIKGFEEAEGGKYITLMSHGEGTYVLRVKPITWNAFSDVTKNVQIMNKVKIPISYELDPGTGKGRITIKIEDAETKGLKDTSISAVYEYAPYLRVGNLEGGMKWDLPLGEAGGQTKALRIGVAMDDTGALHYDVEYSPDYDPEDLGGTHWFEVKKVEYAERPFGTVMKIEHKGGARYLLFDPSSGMFKGEHIGPRDDEYGAVSKYFWDVLSKIETPKPSYDEGEKTWKVKVATSKEFAETWAYADSLLTTQGKGAIATEVIRDLLIKSYPEYFGISDATAINVDLTGQNSDPPYFDMWKADPTHGMKLIFVAEAESRWREWSPHSMFVMCEEALRKHSQDAIEKDFKFPRKGYVFAVHMLQGEIEIWWKEVDLGRK